MTNYQRDIINVAELDLPWQELSGCNILVTGATGLIGNAIVEVLMAKKDRNYHVYAMGRNKDRFKNYVPRYLSSHNLHFIKHDVTTPFNCNIDFQYIIAAASGANPNEYATNPVGVMKSNIMGTDFLLDYGKNHGLKKFVYVSSGEVYGEGDGRVFEEKYSGYVDCATVRACYPSSKRAAETLCVAYAQQYGLDVSIVRPSHVYGPHFTESDIRVYAQFIRNVLAGEHIVMKSRGEQFRSWCYVVDCASAILHVLLKGGKMEAYNIADSQSNISIRELAEMIAELAGKEVVMEIPSETEKSGYNVVTKSVFSTKKLESLGWNVVGKMAKKMQNTIEEKRQYENARIG